MSGGLLLPKRKAGKNNYMKKWKNCCMEKTILNKTPNFIEKEADETTQN